jgi:hypothetical protein
MISHNDADAIYAQALRDNSNLALDWLWAATQVKSASQRAYCLDRALTIDPASVPALEALVRRRSCGEAAAALHKLVKVRGIWALDTANRLVLSRRPTVEHDE